MTWPTGCGEGPVGCESRDCGGNGRELSGRHAVYVGGLTAELGNSPALSVLDNDVCRYIGRLLEGVKINENSLALDAVRETAPIPGFYVNRAHTRERWKREQYMPVAADLVTDTEWTITRKRSALELGQERADLLLEDWESKLPADKEEELDCVLRECRQWYQQRRLA